MILEEGRHYVQIKPVANRINLDDTMWVSTLASDSESNKDFEPNDNVPMQTRSVLIFLSK